MQSFKAAVLDKIEAIAEEHPDRLAGCQYFNRDDTPCCIVGHVLADHGAYPKVEKRGFLSEEFNVVKSAEGTRLVDEGQSSSSIDWTALGIRKPGVRQAQLVREIQANQDSGKTWGEALKIAKSEVG